MKYSGPDMNFLQRYLPRMPSLAFAFLTLAWFIMPATTQAAGAELAKHTTPELGGPFTLVDQNGQTVTEKDFRGKWLLVFFGYTHCPDACPTALSDMAAAISDLDLPRRDQVQSIFITVDPERDTPKVLRDYVNAFESTNIIGLTGTPKQLTVAKAAYRIHAKRHDQPDGEYTMSHTSAIHIINPEGHFVALAQPEQIAERLRQLVP